MIENPGSERSRALLARLASEGVTEWQPRGSFDPVTGVWMVDPTVANEFPEEGIERFGAVDETSFWFRHRNRVILDRIAAHHAGRGLVVEVGSGSGVVAAGLEAEGFSTLCVEPHPAGALAAARRSVSASFCGDLESLQLPASSVPVIGAFDVIEHIPDPLPLLGEMQRVLRGDGIAVFTVPAFPWLWSEMDDWNGHQRRYTRRSLRSQLGAAGFEVVDSTYLFAPLVIPAFVLRVVREKFGRERTPDEVGAAVQEGLSPEIPLLNSIALRVHEIEAALLRRWSIPIGTSVLAVARSFDRRRSCRLRH